MATLFTVGEMAKLSNISKQTLIFYDRKGVFSPNYVDPDNGYRYYSADQLELLDNILILKEMGLSLGRNQKFYGKPVGGTGAVSDEGTETEDGTADGTDMETAEKVR